MIRFWETNLATAFLLCAANAATAQEATNVEFAFLKMSQICANSEGAPDIWRDQAEAAGWTPVKSDLFDDLAEYRTQARLVGIYLAGDANTFPTPITRQATKEVFLEQMRTEEAQMEAFKEQGVKLRPRFYKFGEEANFTVNFTLSEVTPGSGVSQTKQECVINYVGPDLTAIDEQSRLATPDISTSHGIYELAAFGGRNAAGGVVTVSRTKPIDGEKAAEKFGSDQTIYFYSVAYERNN